MSELLKKLNRLYDQPVTRDQLGRRTALPSEIQKAINPTLTDLIDQHPPTEADIQDKKYIDRRKKK